MFSAIFNNRNKRGQITVFIILGLVALIAVALVIYLQGVKVERPSAEETLKVVEVPEHLLPVKSFISECVRQVAKDALKRMGDYGGYTDLSKLRNFVINPASPTDSDGLAFSLKSELKVPYWWYMESDNKVFPAKFASKRPNLYKSQGEPSMEKQLDVFVEDNIDSCIAGFSPLLVQGYGFEDIGEFRLDTTITPEKILFYVDYPITVIKGDNKLTLREFYTDLDVSIGQIYNLATDIINLQRNFTFFERHVKNVIAMLAKTDSKSLPPFSDIDISYSPEIWVKYEVEQKIKSLLATYIPTLQVFGTANYQPIQAKDGERDSSLYELIYNRNMLVPILKNNVNLEARFAYLPNWDIYFDLNCDGQVCRPTPFSTQFPIIGLALGVQKYLFAYDISWPILVEIRDPLAFNGEGYRFQFAMEGNLRNNEPMTDKTFPLTTVEFPDTGSQLCDYSQHTSANVTMRSIDATTFEPLSSFATFTCGFETCDEGEVKGRRNFKLPRCLGGIFGLASNGYFSNFFPLDTYGETNQNFTVLMQPFRKLNISIKEFWLKKSLNTWTFDPQEHFSNKDTQYIISMKRESSDYEEAHSTVAEVWGGLQLGETSYADLLRIVPGNYTVSVFSLYRDELIIPSQERCEGGSLFQKEECFFIPENDIVFNYESPFPIGGIELGKFEITQDLLDNSNTIQFNVLRIALDKVREDDREIDDLEQISRLEELSLAHANLLKPVLVMK